MFVRNIIMLAHDLNFIMIRNAKTAKILQIRDCLD